VIPPRAGGARGGSARAQPAIGAGRDTGPRTVQTVPSMERICIGFATSRSKNTFPECSHRALQ
jgi:hypothetical protein